MSSDRPTRGPFLTISLLLLLVLLPGTGMGVASGPDEARGGQHGGQHDREHAQQQDESRGHDFEDAEEWAERFNDPERDAWQKPGHVLELLGVEEGMTVVDLGTGTGYFLPHLSRAVGATGKVLALDVSEEMIAYVRDEMIPEMPHDNVEAREVAPDDPGLAARGTGEVEASVGEEGEQGNEGEEGETGEFTATERGIDLVLTVNTWHHIRDRADYAARLSRALAPGGKVAVVDFTKESDDGPPVEMRLTPEEVAAELAAGGLEPVVVEAEELPKQYVVVGEKP